MGHGRELPKKPVRLVNTGEEFASAVDAVKKYPTVNVKSISACLKGVSKRAGRMPDTGEWMTWEYVNEEDKEK